MRLTFGPGFVASTAILFLSVFTLSYSGCTQQQADRAQTTLTKVEAATTQVSNAADTIAAAAPSPTANAIQLGLIALLSLEKLFGSYVIPALTKKAGTSPSNSTLGTNAGTATAGQAKGATGGPSLL